MEMAEWVTSHMYAAITPSILSCPLADGYVHRIFLSLMTLVNK